jgi:predicted nucleotidyltransferase component of viral defense system
MPSVGLRFKGGTCLKKCYFADFRFSEDMDFTPEGSAGTEAAREALEEVERPLLDSYSDAGQPAMVRCHSLDEIVLEKVVCLLDSQRIQPRDLYDLVQLADGGSVDFQGVAWRFEEKARFKGLEPARLHDAVELKSAPLKRAWETQLAEQLPAGALPRYEGCERQMLQLLKKHGFVAIA